MKTGRWTYVSNHGGIIFVTKVHKAKSFLYTSIYYQNVRGLRSKTDLFYNNLLNSDNDIIALTETFLISSVHDAELFPPGYVVLRKDRTEDAGWGGVLLAVRNNYSARLITDIDGISDDMEVLIVKLEYKCTKLLCCVVYLPPNYKDDQYLNVLNCLENAICKYSELDVLVLGDFNLNSCSAHVHHQFECFLQFCEIRQYNSIRNNHDGLLDLVLSGLSEPRVRVERAATALVPPDGYHPPLEVALALPRTRADAVPGPMQSHNVSPIPEWNFRKADFSALYASMARIDWGLVLNSDNVDVATEAFYIKLKECIADHVPIKRNRPPAVGKYIYPTWYTPEIVRTIETKYFHLKQYRKTNAEFNREMFRYYRRQAKYLIDIAYKRYKAGIERDITDDPTKFFNYVKSKRKDLRRPDDFTYHDRTVTGQDAANAFAEYFSSVFHSEVPRLDAEEAARDSAARRGDAHDAARVAVNTVSAADLRRAAKRLKPRSSAGPDGIPTFLARDCISVLESPLLYIYNLSLQHAMYPSYWKLSRVTPVPKSTAGSDVTGFRPIAVLSVFGKLFESIVDHLITQQITVKLDDAQHGFRRGRSTTTNHIVLVDYITEAMDARMQVDAAYFDFRKAFDLVDNDILLRKFADIGFTPRLLHFFASYLQDRRQYVKLAGFESQQYYTRSGVSQGSTLGPTQFLVMINDLPRVVSTAKCLMFADDIKLFHSVRDDNDRVQLQNDIDAISEWSENNRLEFNASKCVHISFARLRSPVATEYSLRGMPLHRTDEVRDLGLTLDNQLDFRQHIKTTCKRVSKTLGFIMRMASQFSTIKIAVMLYKAYIRSRLEFGAVVWAPDENKYISMLEKIQKKFARYIYKRQYGYYPYMYPSLFVSGMVGLHFLETRRKLLHVVHYYQLLNNKVDNASVLERMGLHVPRASGPAVGAAGGAGGAVAARRPQRLFAVPGVRTRRGANAPTARARTVLNKIMQETDDIDIFADSIGVFCRKVLGILS